MSTLLAMVVVLIVLGMLLSYHLGYTVGQREGFDRGRETGKHEGSVRAYAVGYDRGRHAREVKEAEENATDEPSESRITRWLWPVLLSMLLSLLGIIAVAALSLP